MKTETYPGTDVLINKFDIRNQKELEEIEQEIVSKAMEEYIELSQVIKTKEDYFAINKYLFSDIYDWAGEKRTFTPVKHEAILFGASITYEDKNNIDRKLDQLFKAADKKNPDKMKLSTFKKHVRDLTADLWRVHPFREGNTRTVYVFIECYCKQFGYKFNKEIIKNDGDKFREALVLANCYHEGQPLLEEDAKPLTEIFDKSIYK